MNLYGRGENYGHVPGENKKVKRYCGSHPETEPYYSR
jgi:hypothetical protein